MLMEPIIIVFIKLMGAAIVAIGTRETQGLRETMTLLCGLVWQCECTAHTLPGAVLVAC